MVTADTMAAAADPPAFHPFPRLPVELRFQIWAFAIPDSFPFLHIREDPDGYRLYGGETKDYRTFLTLLTTNREVRSEIARITGGQWYTLDFSDPAGDTGSPRVWITFKKGPGCVVYQSSRVPNLGPRVWDHCYAETTQMHRGVYLHWIVWWEWVNDCPVKPQRLRQTARRSGTVPHLL
jgi:hypothetical protein